ncbi:similar to Saccharomyces cerevisiae YOL062C APM4 Mu2-like subunit of the clathrin associated protein complex (AP-2) [Maudiozyma barnettii]|uniref:Similar to Saccharomyces cerevisiae YOL062C APM4 Mu2-like subunit of the clathrin associated protein complex (AP-2) n=1 Tax=Maudiozyma barnettii TaxID=61262 RepID=A0A8H2ZJM6_9SACH|nr:Apm4p [Kazachstania barnettii]CAB4257198.1 similar to Saccharomyces cerevisiae YOL062C APM4 Mu2-like subunit of the clathrin associated protein complex (AP-2) [Kazachstania barnettii]CAD1779568.1 similar to Saccharomyces cerevisiae YOL062C APM4 Mu2-like subunit of the clathrin associated protein complex (AP-2) [Kazachstania barnettii]
MLSAVLIYTPRGELVVSKFYKGSIKRSIADIFRIQIINSLDVRSPILTLGSTTFHYIRSTNNMWLVTVNRNNTNSARIWEFLYSLNSILTMYAIDNSESLKEQFMIAYEALGIMLLETGIIVETELTSVVKQMSQKPVRPELITEGSISSHKNNNSHNNHNNASKVFPNFLKPNAVNNVTRTLSTSVSSKKMNKNEVVLYVNERINILVAKDGSILKSYVDGSIDLMSHLQGQQICQFGINDSMAGRAMPRGAETAQSVPTSAATSVELENCKFHQCVDLDKFEQEHIVRFTPPEGSLELMKYHVSKNLNLPFKITPTVTVMTSPRDGTNSCGVDFRINLKSLFPSKLSATDVQLKVPVPLGTIDCQINVTNGSCKFVPEENVMLWKFNKFQGLTENMLSAFTVCSKDTTELSLQQWSRPPISLEFELLMFSNSGLVIHFFNVLPSRDPTASIRTIKWIKYISKSGAYEVRY